MPHPTPHVWKRNGLPSARELPVPYSRRGRHHLAMSQRSNSQTPAALRGRIAYTSRSHPLLTMHEFSFSLRGRWRRVDRNATSSSAIVTETRPGFMGQRFATRTGPFLTTFTDSSLWNGSVYFRVTRRFSSIVCTRWVSKKCFFFLGNSRKF